jgi:aspartate/methionine/tyrosine aminotransferase
VFSRRTGWDLTTNRLAAAIEERRRSGKPVLDLTVSNPTAVGLAYPAAEIARTLSGDERRSGVHVYHPHPLGQPAAREAVAASYAERGITVDTHQIVLTASTSEAYAWIFKLLCDPGDRVLVPRPSYPLFEFLATLESVAIESYPVRHDARWEIDFAFLVESLSGEEGPGSHGSTIAVSSHAARPKARGRSPEGHARAIVLVNPNNPTGSYVSRSDLDRLAALAAERALPLVSDEVFSTYPLDPQPGHVASLLDSHPSCSDGSFETDRSARDARGSWPHRSAGFLDFPAFVLDGLEVGGRPA